MLRKTLMAASISMVTGTLAPSVPAALPTDPAAFISSLGNQALGVIRSDVTLDQKVAYFRGMLRSDFDLAGISQFVLGGYWRVASPAQREEFGRLFENYLLRTYGERFAQIGGGDLRVGASLSEPAGLIVTSQIIRPQGPPIEVDWRLQESGGFYKIGDVTLDGVSMALSYRVEFAREIQRNGGVQGFLQVLRSKTENSV